MRVLLIAEQANPEWVSVPLVGWSLYAALAARTQVHLVTQVRNRDAIARAGRAEGVDFTALDTEAVARPLHRLAELARGGSGRGWTAVTALQSLGYYAFERAVWRRFGAALRAGRFDLVHRVTPLSPTAPSPLAARCARLGVPFVIGPLNGGLPWPAGFEGARRREREWLGYVRGAYKLLPGYRATRRHASALVVGSRATYEQLPAACRPRCVYVPENGIDPARFARPAHGAPGRPLRVAFVGRLVPYKGCDMLLEAAAPLVRAGDVAVDVIGDGPERARLAALVAEHALGAGVRLDGWVEHAELPARLARVDVLGFPSVREFGGGVALEAMALGLVPVVVDYGGPGELVTDATGFRVPIGPRASIVAGVRAVLAQLVAHPERVRPMGERARRRALRLFTWDAKAEQIAAVYDWVLGRRGARPDFGMPFPDEPERAAPAPPEGVVEGRPEPGTAAGRSS